MSPLFGVSTVTVCTTFEKMMCDSLYATHASPRQSVVNLRDQSIQVVSHSSLFAQFEESINLINTQH